MGVAVACGGGMGVADACGGGLGVAVACGGGMGVAVGGIGVAVGGIGVAVGAAVGGMLPQFTPPGFASAKLGNLELNAGDDTAC